MNTETQSPHPVGSSAWLDPLRNQHRVQGEHGNWNCNDYMLGMFNGLECALATLEHREPQYRNRMTAGSMTESLPASCRRCVMGLTKGVT